MAFPKFQTKEVLNKVLNTGEDALNVDLADSVTVEVNLDHTDDSVQLWGNESAAGSGTARAILTDSAGHLQVDVLTAPTTAVTGTFYQATQPVSLASAPTTAVTGTFWQSTQPVSLASVPTHAVTISDTSFAVADGSALGEGVLVQGDDGGDRKNIHVDATTGDVQVDVTDIVPGVAAASLGKAEDAAHGSGDTGVVALVVRNDVLENLTDTDGDYSVLQVNKTGALNVTETVGHLGAHYENTTGTIDSLKIVAFQFLEDTKFSVLTPATSAYIGNTSSGGDDVASGDVFPQGMTIFGRWTAFTLVADGRVIAYLGDW